MKNTINLLFIIFISSILLTSCNDKKEQQANAAVRSKVFTVDGVVLSPQKLIESISVSGTIKSYEEVELTSEISGRITKLNINEGQFVKSGTLLVKLYDEDLQANLSKLNSQLDIQQEIFDRQAELLSVEGISKNDYEQSKLQIASL
ncbi:MAG: biotin/lipoyl-binding protein [Saprospiraceae bacterium]